MLVPRIPLWKFEQIRWDEKRILLVLRYIGELGSPLFKADGSIELDLNKIKGRKGRRFCRSTSLILYFHSSLWNFKIFNKGQTGPEQIPGLFSLKCCCWLKKCFRDIAKSAEDVKKMCKRIRKMRRRGRKKARGSRKRGKGQTRKGKKKRAKKTKQEDRKIQKLIKSRERVEIKIVWKRTEVSISNITHQLPWIQRYSFFSVPAIK